MKKALLIMLAGTAGYQVRLPWGNAQERARAERIAAAIPTGLVLPRFSLSEMAAELAAAAGVVGADTGLCHLAAALDQQAAAALEFEQAARYRDQIAGLSRIQERQYVSGERGDLDIVACAIGGGSACVQVFFIRGGRNLGNKVFFPNAPAEIEGPELISAFIARHYLGTQVPAEILVSEPPADLALLERVADKLAMPEAAE